MDSRQLKALELAARMRITYQDGAWHVPSQSGQGTYRVTLSPRGHTCTCPDFELTGKECKHIYASLFVRERDCGGQALLIDPAPPPERVTYRQDWPKYNEAQENEKPRFLALLHDLCRGVPEPERTGVGRKPHRVSDAIFTMALKVYTLFSSRRFNSDLAEAHERGYLSRPVPGQKVNAFMESEALTPTLRQLVARSALPLRTVEVDFAADSSGFSASKFEKWYDHKYGVQRTGQVWVKAHIMTGVKTNVITAVEIKDKDAADCPQYAPLLEATARRFTVEEVSADKAYLSEANLEATLAVGGKPFIPFKVNSSPGKSGLWDKMLGYFQYRREDFLKHYHARSNVESTFSMIKAKFRDHVRSKTDVAMKNEVLCKVLCHNVCCVIQAQCELGIAGTFWPESSGNDKGRAVLPLIRPI